MSDLPEPLTPPDCNLRGFRWMPLDVERVIDSDLFGISTGDEFKIAFRLWAKSWTQVPAASLPSEDKLLAHLAGLSENMAKWRRVRDVALRGWIKCSDDRLYHPVIAEKAIEAMDKRDDYEDKQDNRDNRQARYRERRSAMFKTLRDHGIVPDGKTSMDELQRLIASLGVTESVTDETQSVTRVTSLETAKTGTGQDKTVNLKTEGNRTDGGTPPATVRPSDLSAAMRRHSIEAQPGDPRIIAAAAAGMSVETIDAACAEAKSENKGGAIKAGFVLAIANRWTADAARPWVSANARASPQSVSDKRAHTIAVLTGREPAEHDRNDPFTIDA